MLKSMLNGWWSIMLEIVCQRCGKKKMVPPSRISQKYCSKYCVNNSKERNNIISESRKGHKVTNKTRQKISNTLKGNVPWNKGKKFPGKVWGKPFLKGHPRERTIEHSIKISKALTGKKASQETIQKLIKSHTDKKASQETRRKMRIAKINHLEKCVCHGGQLSPGYNHEACEWFKQFDIINNTLGQHAESENKEGEYHIKSLGYFVDYINHEEKIIIEWDEKHHNNEKQKASDITRQKEIMRAFPDYLFARLKQDDNPDVCTVIDIKIFAHAQKQSGKKIRFNGKASEQLVMGLLM